LPSMEGNARVRAVFEGRVQGVGFRFTACHLAAKHPEVAGYVRNVPDGTVELVIEGKRAALSSLLADIERTMARYISRVRSVWEEPTGEFESFGVRF